MSEKMMNQIRVNDPTPWWKFGHVWMVIAGPAIVVVAGFITLYLAISRPDPVITDYYQKGLDTNKTLESKAVPDQAAKDAYTASMAPATQARNHAQTGVKLPVAQPVKP